MRFHPPIVLLLSAGLRLVSSQASGALASWMTNVGPAIVWQNGTTGNIMVSLDTGSGSNDGYSAWANMPTTTRPKNSTAIAATGFTGGDGNIYAYIYYMASGGVVTQDNIKCSFPEAVCQTTGVFGISNGAGAAGVNNVSGLAATQRTGWDGYRALYQDADGLVHEVRYSGEQNITEWSNATLVNGAANQTIGMVNMDLGNNLTAYSISGTGEVLASALTGNDTWNPFTSPISTENWPAWHHTNVTISSTVDPSKNLSKGLFYIGTDRSLHEITTTDNWKTQSVATAQSADIWPLADVPNARFTATNDTGGVTLSIFYISGGELVCVQRSSSVWANALTIMATSDTNSTTTTTTAPAGATNTTTANPGPTTKSSSNDGVKIGAGVGVGVGVPLLAGLIFLGYFLTKRKKNKANAARSSNGDTHHEEAPAYTEHKPKVPLKDPNEVSADNVPRAEMGGFNPQYELPTQEPIYEAPGHEMPYTKHDHSAGGYS